MAVFRAPIEDTERCAHALGALGAVDPLAHYHSRDIGPQAVSDHRHSPSRGRDAIVSLDCLRRCG